MDAINKSEFVEMLRVEHHLAFEDGVEGLLDVQNIRDGVQVTTSDGRQYALTVTLVGRLGKAERAALAQQSGFYKEVL